MPAIRFLIVKTRKKTPTRCFVIDQKRTKTSRLLFLIHLETHEKNLPCVLIPSCTTLGTLNAPTPAIPALDTPPTARTVSGRPRLGREQKSFMSSVSRPTPHSQISPRALTAAPPTVSCRAVSLAGVPR